MILATVTGEVEAPIRLQSLGDASFVRVTTDDGASFVAVDTLHTTKGNRVMLCQGTVAQSALGGLCPVDAAITGILSQGA